MPITLSYDLAGGTTNDRTYIRSMLERFHWQRLGGSVFRYKGVKYNGEIFEDWLNHVAPSLMFFRSYVLSRGITIEFLTIDASGTTFLDQREADATFGSPPTEDTKVILTEPTNPQSSVKTIRIFMDAATDAVRPSSGASD